MFRFVSLLLLVFFYTSGHGYPNKNHDQGNFSVQEWRSETHNCVNKFTQLQEPLTHTEDVKSVSESNDQFAKKLYHQLYSEDGNLILSPFSVSAAMAMLSAGAKGSTLKVIQDGMSFPEPQSLQLGYSDVIPALTTNENFTLEAANSLFLDKDGKVLSTYEETLSDYYHAKVQSTDFEKPKQAARFINEWVSEKTREKITDLVSEETFEEPPILVLVNAIYFNGNWIHKFDPKLTSDEDFHITSDETIKVKMMKQKNPFLWAQMENYQMLEMEYKGDRAIMQILLPNSGEELQTIEEELDPKALQKEFYHVSDHYDVELELPKFKIKKTIKLNEKLKKLGMSELFVGASADLSGITGDRSVFVSEVVQEAFIDVNEEGTEAAAVTKIHSGAESNGPPPAEFIVDRPFLFFLRDRLTGMLLFQGRVTDPSV